MPTAKCCARPSKSFWDYEWRFHLTSAMFWGYEWRFHPTITMLRDYDER
jgi:hypothetical protein